MNTRTLNWLCRAALFVTTTSTTLAESTIVADYKLAKHSLGAVQGPATIKNRAGGKFHLSRVGEPQYYNVAPGGTDEGQALQFNGTHAGYQLKTTILTGKNGFILEGWIRPQVANAPGLHGMIAHGHGDQGYTIAQQGDKLGVFVGAKGFIPVQTIVKDQWVHVALVFSNKQKKVYINGVPAKANILASSGVAANFSIGFMGTPKKEQFKGDISHVRLASIGPKGFDVKKDLLLDYSVVEKHQKEAAAVARKRINSILQGVPLQKEIKTQVYDQDWLVNAPNTKSTFQVVKSAHGDSAVMELGNGLVSRKFYLGENLVCYSLKQNPENLEFLRSIKPEATLTIDGQKFLVGGLKFPSMANGQKGRGGSNFVANYFLEKWLPKLVPHANSFRLTKITTNKPQAWLKWEPMEKDSMPWPPKGLTVSMTYTAPASTPKLKGLEVTVHYEIYDGIPVIGKWLSFKMKKDNPVNLDRTLIEELAITDDNANLVFIESEYNHFCATPTRWHVDPEFKTDSGPVFTERMSDYRLRYWDQDHLDDAAWHKGPLEHSKHKKWIYSQHPEWIGEYCSRGLLQVQYPEGPDKTLKKGESWKTFRSWTLLQDSMNEDRKGLGRRKLYRTLMPWTNENLVYMHVLSHNTDAIKKAVDQCVECGFDMIVLTFGSGFNMMSTDPKYKARIKEAFAYAKSKGIKTGAYILFSSSRSYGNGEHDVKPPAYGRSLCLGSEFGDQYFKQILSFMKEVGMDCIETDGPYHGFRCEATHHKHHKGVKDSWRVNWEQQAKFYRMCMEQGIYIITPDWYFASGGRKMPMGYKESNWTLPREQQALVARQNIYDGTWWRTASMCYHALPLSSVYGGGPESTMEPLSKHLDAYDRVLAQYFGMGIMACYRGFRLYDTKETKAVVRGWRDFYHRHNAIIESDIIHVSRPNGRDLDCMMHANAKLEEKGLAFIWNPTHKSITRNYKLPLYYTGIEDTALISQNTSFKTDGEFKSYKLDRKYKVTIPVTVPANGYVWFLIKQGK